ncbi:MAG: S49 family peptidase [Candidatus Zeuxoniibacter abyssi]|nr:MAG: S49 family peptidase [Candidatus Persebacteraceae bacterium AB1(2)]
MPEEFKDRALVEKLAFSALVEQRAKRRWGVFFKLLIVGYVIALSVYVIIQSKFEPVRQKEHVAVISISGPIIDEGPNSALAVNRQLRLAFEDEKAKGVILRINSPGGSAVESNRIFQEIRRLRKKYAEKEIYAVAGDLCASGGYFIAAATDKIYVDEASLLGSIGVVFSSFGFTGALEKLGVERRVLTAGENKNMFDPFLPKNPADEERLREILSAVQQNFSAAVKQGRGERLSGDDEIFSGAVFDGKKSIRLGLADGIGDTAYVARELIGVENLLYYGEENNWLEDVVKKHLVQAFSFISAPQIR